MRGTKCWRLENVRKLQQAAGWAGHQNVQYCQEEPRNTQAPASYDSYRHCNHARDVQTVRLQSSVVPHKTRESLVYHEKLTSDDLRRALYIVADTERATMSIKMARSFSQLKARGRRRQSRSTRVYSNESNRSAGTPASIESKVAYWPLHNVTTSTFFRSS